MLLALSIVLAFPSAGYSQAWSGIISPSRAIDWSNAGVAIPSRTTQCGATLNSGATAAQISSALSSCPSGQFVSLGPGTFNLSSPIDFGTGKSNVTLRGQGADSTFLVFSGSGGCNFSGMICMQGDDSWPGGGEDHTANWTAGYAAGTTQITLSNSLGIVAGTTLVSMDQADEASDTGNIWNCFVNGVCANGDGSGGFLRGSRSQQQEVLVTACSPSCNNSGSTVVTISPGIYMPNWRSSQSPQVWWANTYATMDGVENLAIDYSSATSQAGIVISNCYGCWVKGIRSTFGGRDHIMIYGSAHAVVRDSYFYQSRSHLTVSYGVETAAASSDNLIENNIFDSDTDSNPSNTGGGAGNVAGYNYTAQTFYSSAGWFQASDYDHSSGFSFWLREGNQGVGFNADNVHGTHHFTTLFRNYYAGYQAHCPPGSSNACSANTIAVNLYGGDRYFNVIGNIMGTSGYHTTYKDVAPSGTGGPRSVMLIGWVGNNGTPGTASFCADFACTGTVNYDPLNNATLMLWGNYDVVNAAPQWNSSEVPSGIPLYANAVPASHTLPASFYLPGRPSWWNASIPFPAKGPDVTGGNIAGLGGFGYNNPAAVCYANTSSTNGILNFNADSCYAGSSSTPDPSITAAAGTPQSATVNTSFGTALATTVKDASNNLLSGMTVTFTAPASGASGTFTGGSTTATATTNSKGVATAPTFTANGTGGSYTVTASVSGAVTPASFSLTNNAIVPGPAASIAAMAGTPQSATVSTNFGTALTATVKDASNNLLSGVAVTFTAPASGASGTFTGGSTTATATTNGSGMATAPIFTANGTAGSYTVAASVSGVGAPANFSLTNNAAVPGPPASVTAATGTPQSATVSTSFGTALTATVKDASNNLLSSVAVTFTAPASGASGTFAGGSTTATATTNSSGVATAPTFTANGTAGSYTLTASVSGVGTPASFSLTNNAAVPGPPASITATGGTAQSATVSTSFGTALAATVKDASNNLLSGVTVTFTAPASGASGTFAGGSTTATATTNSSGVATSPTFTANGTAGSYTVAASVSGVGTPANFSLTNTAAAPGPPASITAMGGTAQSATVSTSFGTALAASVKDASNNLLSGVTVTFTAPASGASGIFAGGSMTATATTNSSGVATAPAFTANGTAGSYTVTASVSGLSTQATFSLTNVAVPPVTSTVTNLTIPANGGVQWSWPGSSSSAIIGFADVQLNTPLSPSSTAIIAERVNGVLVSAVSVPASHLTSSGRSYVNLNAPRTTGIAFANPSTKDAAISFYFTDTSGNDFGSGVFTLTAGSQTAAFLNQPPFNGPSMEGTFTFSSSVPVGAMALQALTNQRGELLYTSVPLAPVGVSSSDPVILSDFANGGGWSTLVIMTNPTDSLITGTVQFYSPGSQSQNGQPVGINVNGQSGSVFNYSIPSHSAVRLATSGGGGGGGGGKTRTGSVRIIPSSGSAPTSAAILSYINNGINVLETSVSGLPTGTTFRTYAQMPDVAGQTGSIVTGIAIANPLPSAATVNLEAVQFDGTTVGQGASVTVPGDGEVSQFIDKLMTNLPPNFQGLLKVTSNSPIAFTGVLGQYNERGDFLMTTTTPRDDNQASSDPNPEVILPQVVSGGGYATEIIVFGPAGTGTMRLNSQGGTLQ